MIFLTCARKRRGQKQSGILPFQAIPRVCAKRKSWFVMPFVWTMARFASPTVGLCGSKLRKKNTTKANCVFFVDANNCLPSDCSLFSKIMFALGALVANEVPCGTVPGARTGLLFGAVLHKSQVEFDPSPGQSCLDKDTKPDILWS